MSMFVTAARPRWEIFCQVVDNFGDIGVCWRLARDLARRDTGQVRLWVDDWGALERICPAVAQLDAATGCTVDGVVLRRWDAAFAASTPGKVVIEAFACELPAAQLEAMAAQWPPPVWINLEYLSAEDWVAGCHAMASPHPRLPLVKHFFFPGFDEGTGGLLRELDLLARRDAFVARPEGLAAWLAARGIYGGGDALRVSLFAYEQPELPALFECWRHGARDLLVLVPESRVLGDVARALDRGALKAGDRVERGRLAVQVLPFTDQIGYDELLWACDLNFVRGEDSFVRAQWAARPFVWQIYPQSQAAHHDKLDAFLARYLHGVSDPAAQALAGFWRAWNACAHDADGVAAAWPAFAAALPALSAHAQHWCTQQAARADLATTLTEFCFHSPHAAR
ncbi:MAG: elongation factor P maturation arginine rhamnosyltransferase EarP [Thauera sp.]|nr:elongation factor P maturation arginine rhamnosyltransferase EarP [Thauera sp.]